MTENIRLIAEIEALEAEIEALDVAMSRLADSLAKAKREVEKFVPYKGQQVLMSEVECLGGLARTFACICEGMFVDTLGTAWSNCEPDPDAFFTWIKHDGSDTIHIDGNPDITVLYLSGAVVTLFACNVDWVNVGWWAIINKPELVGE